jgi:UDP-GlcNAc:undecaprenyl-phosphate GlcNAc-1-phosphate transferase
MFISELYSLLAAGLGTLLLLRVLQPVALRIGLVDHPKGHKHHTGEIPSIGGIAMFGGFWLTVLILDVPFTDWFSFFTASAFLMIIGVWDDVHALPALPRFVAQIAAALMMIFEGGLMVENLGNILGNGTVDLTDWAVPFTVFIIVGGINAVNMIDGVDGLAGSLVLLFVLSLAGFAVLHGLPAESKVLLIFALAIVAFLILNLRLPGRQRAKIFMGDAGSMFLGLAISWFFIHLSKTTQNAIVPVTALWLFAIPVMDTVSLIFKRLLRGRSPFVSNRDHLHHILLQAGYSVNQTLIIILLLEALFIGIGLLGNYWKFSEAALFYGFLGLFTLYFLVTFYSRHVLSQGQVGETTAVPPYQSNPP